jgi:hypothetical protein
VSTPEQAANASDGAANATSDASSAVEPSNLWQRIDAAGVVQGYRKNMAAISNPTIYEISTSGNRPGHERQKHGSARSAAARLLKRAPLSPDAAPALSR